MPRSCTILQKGIFKYPRKRGFSGKACLAFVFCAILVDVPTHSKVKYIIFRLLHINRWHSPVFVLLSFFIFSTAPAQSTYLDSLERELNRENISDTARAELLIEIGSNLYRSDKDVAKKYFSALKDLAQKRGDGFYESRAYSGFGDIYYETGSYDTAMMFYQKADTLLAGDPSQIAWESRATNKASMANIEIMRNNYDIATQYYLNAIAIMEKSNAENKWKVLGSLYEGPGSIYHDLNQFDKALEYDLKALEAHKKQKDNLQLTGILELYVAADYIDIKDLNKAKIHIQNAEEIAKELKSTTFYYRLYSQWGRFYQKSSSLPQAIENLQKALQYAEASGDKFKRMNAYRIIGFAYRDMNDYGKSADALKKALALTKELKNYRLITETLKKLADVEAFQKHHPEAVDHYQQYIKLNDSLNKAATEEQINEIENKYQSRQKSDSILVLQKSSQLQQLALHKKEYQNIFIIVVASLFLLTGLLFYRNLRNRHRLLKQSEQLHRQQITQLEKERQLIAAQSLMKGQEEERSRLAKDLHDGVGGLLSGVKLSLSNMKGNVFLSEENARAVTTIITQLDSSIAELRRVSHNMMPEALIKYGLKEALENYCEGIDQSGRLNIRLQTYGLEQRLEQDTEIILYRIVQELLNNVIRHADAKEVLIQLVREGGRFSLTVEDDGRGFDMNSPEYKAGAGLQNIQARAGYLNGVVDIRTQPGEGTSITIEGTMG